MWSMSRSLAAVQTPPSKGLVHDPDVAVQAELVWTLVPSRLSTNSLMGVSRGLVGVDIEGPGGEGKRTGCCSSR